MSVHLHRWRYRRIGSAWVRLTVSRSNLIIRYTCGGRSVACPPSWTQFLWMCSVATTCAGRVAGRAAK